MIDSAERGWDTDASSITSGQRFTKLMRRYVVDYTNRHDQTQTTSIMEADYRLRMGDHLLVGRDGAYATATRKQFDQFPGLALTVHELWTSGERLAMRFSEHGASIRHDGALAAWGGIGLYSWNGERLTMNSVEQDYFARAAQLRSGEPAPVDPPAVAPWDTIAQAPSGKAEAIVSDWLRAGRVTSTPGVLCDDNGAATGRAQWLTQVGITINDLFSCGTAVAFHVTQEGPVTTECAISKTIPDQSGRLHMAGIVHVADGAVATGRVIRNRLDLQRSLVATDKPVVA